MFTMLNKWEIFVNQIYFIYFYMPNKNKTWEWCNVRDAEKKSKESLTENTAQNVE